MKKKILIVAFSLMIAGIGQAQEYKLAKSTGKLIIKEVNNVSIEGTSGSEILFSSMDRAHEKDHRYDVGALRGWCNWQHCGFWFRLWGGRHQKSRTR